MCKRPARFGLAFTVTLRLHFIHRDNGERIILNRKADIESGEGDTVYPVRLTLVRRPGVVTLNADGGGLLVLWQDVTQRRGEIYLQ